jgi:GTP-binding protein EngB required for normal cell division
MTKADKVEKDRVQAVLEESKQKLSEFNFEQFFVTSALAMQGIEAPFAAAAEGTLRDGLTVSLRPAGKSACC